jgi:hypothetical protein
MSCHIVLNFFEFEPFLSIVFMAWKRFERVSQPQITKDLLIIRLLKKLITKLHVLSELSYTQKNYHANHKFFPVNSNWDLTADDKIAKKLQDKKVMAKIVFRIIFLSHLSVHHNQISDKFVSSKISSYLFPT